jgi:hypothetical protein
MLLWTSAVSATAPLLPHALLAAAAPGYLTDQQWEGLDGRWLNHALEYTGQPCRGVRGPLTLIRLRPGQPVSEEPCYRLADSLDQIGQVERQALSVPAATWDALLDHGEETGLEWLGHQAEKRGLYRYAFRFYSAVSTSAEIWIWI